MRELVKPWEGEIYGDAKATGYNVMFTKLCKWQNKTQFYTPTYAFRRLNSNSTFLVLKNVAKTSINAISSEPVTTLNSKSLKNILRQRYNSAYARLH
jgi:hypothetical protein